MVSQPPKLPYIPRKYLKGYMLTVLQSVTVEIHRQSAMLQHKNITPSRVMLGPVCSRRFAYEQNKKNPIVSDAPKEYNGLQIEYNCDHIGVIVI